MFTSSTPVAIVEAYLIDEVGTIAEFIDNVDDELPRETMTAAMVAVNDAIGSVVHWDLLTPEIGRKEDVIEYFAHCNTGAEMTWSCYIEEAREAE
jgi:hypothetical protein